jgi:hypothetical protein
VCGLQLRSNIRTTRTHNWLGFGKFQGTQRFLIPCPRHDSSRLPPSGETCKNATAPSTQKNLERFSTYWCGPLRMWPSRLLYHRCRKSRRDLWITLYLETYESKSILYYGSLCLNALLMLRKQHVTCSPHVAHLKILEKIIFTCVDSINYLIVQGRTHPLSHHGHCVATARCQ